jgi:hypothetical protein
MEREPGGTMLIVHALAVAISAAQKRIRTAPGFTRSSLSADDTPSPRAEVPPSADDLAAAPPG